MFFTRANVKSSQCLTGILQRYKEASGQTINNEKSSITFSRRTPGALRTLVKDALDIQKEGGVGKYLGLPEQFGRKKRDLFTSIVDRIRQKGSSWSNRFLSKAGKMIMIKSVLSPIPSHAMTCFKLPVSLCKRIQSAVTRFWWDDVDGQNKMAWVSWDRMTQPKAIGGLGFRDFQAFNDAFLGKLSWRILNKPELLLSRILMGKYCQAESFLDVSQKSASSHGWRGVLLGRDLLKRNMGWVVGDGTSIQIWDDAWLSLSTQLRPTGPATESTASLIVADLFEEGTRNWNTSKIRQILPQWEKLIKTIIPSETGAPDKQIWLSTPSGEYTTKSGYHEAIKMRTEEGGHPESRELEWFKGVWNLHISPKIKMFLWKLFQQALPVGEILMARHITTESQCPRCGTPESIDHLFLHCQFAKDVWQAAPFTTTFEYSGLIDLQDVWLNLCGRNCLPPTGLATGHLAPWILWHLWCARNQLVFEGKSMSAEETLTKAVTTAKEWTNSQEKDKQRQTYKTPARVPDLQNRTVVNSDAAWRATTGTAGLGWTLRNEEGSHSFTAGAQHVGSVLIAEGLALKKALSSCKDRGIKRIHCFSDSAQLMKAVNGGEFYLELYGIISDVFAISCCFDEISFSWISREKNKEADLLAKHCLVEEEAIMAGT